jgi:hypothetical protein
MPISNQLPTMGRRVWGVVEETLLTSRYFRRNKQDDDGYETNVKLVPDPRTHFDVEFELLGAISQDGALVAQSRSTFTTAREFEISTDTGDFKLIVGGDATTTGITATPGVWRFKFDGTDTEVYRNESLLYTIATSAGNDFSLAATFSMCMSRRLTTTYENFYKGILANVLVRNVAGEPTNGYAIASNSNDVPDTIGSADAVVIEGLAGDWALYTKQTTGDWLGQELVVNGGFDTASDWVEFGDVGSLNISNGVMRVTRGAAYSGGYQGVMLFAGINYRIAKDSSVLSGTPSASFAIRSGAGGGGSAVYVNTTVGHVEEDYLEAATATRYITPAIGSNAGIVEYANISVKEVLNVA